MGRLRVGKREGRFKGEVKCGKRKGGREGLRKGEMVNGWKD